MPGADTALLVLLLIARSASLFGTRHIDATEHHEGMVAGGRVREPGQARRLPDVGVYVTYVMFDGFGDMLPARRRRPADDAAPADRCRRGGSHADWLLITALSSLAFLFLTASSRWRSIENVDETHLRTASWLLPVYLLAINLFVLPIALAGCSARARDGDRSCCAAHGVGQRVAGPGGLLGGLSAATAMIIVDTVALSSTMISNDLVMPVLLRVRSLGIRSAATCRG